jgi:hypothetical protein
MGAARITHLECGVGTQAPYGRKANQSVRAVFQCKLPPTTATHGSMFRPFTMASPWSIALRIRVISIPPSPLSSTFALFPGGRPLRARLGGAHAFALPGDSTFPSSSGHAHKGRVVSGCRAVQKHWLHRDKLGGGPKVRNSNLGPFCIRFRETCAERGQRCDEVGRPAPNAVGGAARSGDLRRARARDPGG